MTGAGGRGSNGGGRGGGTVPSATSGGEFLLQLLQKPYQPQQEPPAPQPINGAAASHSHHDPAVAAMGPALSLPPWASKSQDHPHHPWPQSVNPTYPSNSFLQGFHPNLWTSRGLSPPSDSNFPANQLFLTDGLQHLVLSGSLGINGKLDCLKQQQEQHQKQRLQQQQQQQREEKNMLMFGSLACELGNLDDRNSLDFQNQRRDKAPQFSVQKVLEAVEVNEVNGRVDGLQIGSNSGGNLEFDRRVNLQGTRQLNHHGHLETGGGEGVGRWERQKQHAGLERSPLTEPKRTPPGFPQKPKGVDHWGSMSRRKEVDLNAALEEHDWGKLNHQTYISDDKHDKLKGKAPKFGGIEENASSRLGLIQQLDHPGPPMGSNLHSAPASDIEESLASMHSQFGGSGSNELTGEENWSGDEMRGSVYEAYNQLEGEDLAEHFVDSLVFGDGLGRTNVERRHSESNKESRSNRTRQPRAIGQRRKNYRRPVQCRMDIEKLTAPFLAIYEYLVPPEEEKAKQKQLLALLEKLVSKEWPRAKLYLYGSCANSFGVSNSDIDVCLAIDNADIDKSELLLRLADILQSDNLQNVQALTHARVPIVKLMDPVTGISCDICINNVLAVVNTKLLRDYGQIDGRLRQLAFIVKHWAKLRRVNMTYEGTLSSYAYVIMCIHFLQQRKPAILPCLQEMTATYIVKVDDVECAFFDRVDLLRDFGSQNRESIAQLVWAFFDYWANRHDYANDVISIRTGNIISKQEKDWTRRIGRDCHLICIEDPFEISHDLGRVVDKYSIKDLRAEFERAAYILQYDPNPCVTLFEPYVPTT